ncbi:MAG: aromatic ring-hydroxylating dioxygenase subunit alpha [Hellea sp.]|nr:aromatic ring-hydroxylating dioxygenase subunit alpha [Hellea sp.]
MQDGYSATKIKALVKAQPKGHALLRGFYKDPDIYEAEMQTLFGRHWLFAGHVSQIPNIGNYILVEFDTESIIVTRTEATEFSAHMNVCRHRGSRICLEKSGHAKSFTCPYHAWAYDLRGNLIAAGQMEAGFDKTAYSLRAVQVENIHGFLLISLADAPLSLAPMKNALGDILPIFETENLQLAEMKSYEIEANWKLAVENYQECYHCAPAHKEFAQIHAMARDLPRFKALKSEYEKTMPSGGIMSEKNGYFDLAEPGAEGFQYGRNPLLEGCQTGSKDGTPLAPFLGRIEAYTGGASELMLGPFMYFLIYDDHMVGYRFRPTAIDRCVCDIYWFVRDSARAGQDYDLEPLTWLWDVTTEADKTIIRRNQAGVNSRYYKPGPLSQMEHFQQSFLNWYLAALGR